MELLPESFCPFRSDTAWRALVKKDGAKFSQRYGRPSDFKPIFQHELGEAARRASNSNRTELRILGIEEPSLPICEKLYHDFHCRSVVLVDESASFITAQSELGKGDTIKFKCASVMTKSAPTDLGKFDWVIDHINLDLQAGSENAIEGMQSRIEALQRLLTDAGKLFLLTLGHESVLQAIVRHLTSSKYLVRLYPVATDRSASGWMTFVFVISPSGEAEGQTMVVCDYRAAALDVKGANLPSEGNAYQIFRMIRNARRCAFWDSHIATAHAGNLKFFQIVPTGARDRAAYTISLYDRKMPTFANPHVRQKFKKGLKPTIAILVPLTEQHHWLYKSEAGHQKLAERAGCKRVLCVFLPEFGPIAGPAVGPVETVDRIKEDIGRFLLDLSLAREKPVLLMTQQENFVDERREVHRTHSPMAGQILIFDSTVDEDDEELRDPAEADKETCARSVKASGYIRRAMIFECNPRMAQTEVWYIAGGDKPRFEFLHICHSYHVLALAAVSMVVGPLTDPFRGIILGLGGGVLAMTMKRLFGSKLSLEAVDIDPVVCDVAETYFGLERGNGLDVVVSDGLDYVENLKCDAALNFIVVDINSTEGDIGHGFDGVSCPPRGFLESAFLNKAQLLLGSEGLLIVNSVAHTFDGRCRILDCLRSTFPHILALKHEFDLNEVFVCKLSKLPIIGDARSAITKLAKDFPEVNRLIAKTPFYMSKNAAFIASAEDL